MGVSVLNSPVDYVLANYGTASEGAKQVADSPISAALERSPIFGQPFSFTLNSGNDKTQLSLSGPARSTTNSSSAVTPPVNNSDWRFKGFGNLYGAYGRTQSTGLLPNGLTPVSHVPGAYTTSPDAYHQVLSRPAGALSLPQYNGFQSYLNRGF